ncbi:hypothetical protein AOQ84DRAFT_225548 [Glonium stellatum]|uniref:Protein kinase domain-containing protein n=1 Tax=Glonium stellatum TaxID=574774 RepID=A0A8E2ETZ0_9PEZI|nr:hypothetical protein AOQ84DRAFT_225548 [Glonium stellatum]
MSVVGEISFALRVTDDVIKVLTFITGWVQDARHFGGDVHAFRALLASETARLQGFIGFLQESTNSGSRFESLPSINRTAIVWTVEELDMTFSSYAAFVQKHSVEELQRGYESDAHLETNTGKSVERGKQTVERVQSDTSFGTVTKWGLFGKRKLEKLLRDMEEWNTRLQNLLLCGLCFGSEPIRFDERERPALNQLRLSTGLSLRVLLAKQNPNSDVDIIQPGLALESDDSDSHTQWLIRQTDRGTERQKVLVEFKSYQLRRKAAGPSKEMIRQVETLAKLLIHPKAPNAGFRTLHCVGVVHQKASTRFAFAFNLPRDLFPVDQNPPSLFQLIESKGGRRPTLGQRFAMARALAETIFQLHSVNWLHKSIRSENVIFGYDSDRNISYDKPYLIGFEFSRMGNDRSTTEHDDLLERNIYRHPDRQGPPNESQRFTVLHDIYALGVVLLEIGLWRTVIGFDDYEDMEAEAIMLDIQENAKDRLPHYTGLDYEEAVSACLKGTLIGAERSKQLVLPVYDQQRVEVNMALFKKVVRKIEIGSAIR